MCKITATMDAGNRVVIPKAVRNAMKLKPGDTIEVEVTRKIEIDSKK